MPTGERPTRGAASPEGPAVPRIAVLYFEVMSADADDAYLAAGLTDDLIVDLTQVEGIHVASRADVQPYRERSVPPRTLAREINVNYVLTGSVRRAGNRARFSAQLVRATDGHVMWAERFDRTLEDLFDVQAEVSKRIVEALEVALKPGEKEMLDRKPSDSPEAYSYYLQARNLMDSGRTNNRRAEALLKRSVEIDPKFALGHAALGECHAWRGLRWWAEPTAAADAAEPFAKRALEIDPNLLEAIMVLAMVHRLRGEEEKLISGLQEITRRDPDNAQALEWAGWSYMTLGKPEAAIEVLERLTEQRPDLYVPLSFLSGSYDAVGRPADAKAARQRSFDAVLTHVEKHPDDALARAYLGIDLIRADQVEEGLAQARLAADLAADDGRTMYNVACAYARANRPDEAMDALKQASLRVDDYLTDWPERDPDLQSLHDIPEFRRMFMKSDKSS
jgi:adenylate cyclase